MESKSSVCQEVRFKRGNRSLTAKRWHQGGEPTLALHGWLDNANSFNYLAPRLPQLDIIALDFAGHGHSDNRPMDVAYRGDLDIEDVLAVVAQVGWDRFNLIGHSMGAEYGSQLAGLFPDMVSRLVCIDGFVECVEPDKKVAMRAKRIQANLKASTSRLRVYASLKDMAEAVVGATKQDYESAFELVQRGHKAVADGFCWITDPRLKQDSWEIVGSGELGELIKQTTAATLVIDASYGQHWFRPSLAMVDGKHTSLKVGSIEGSHHLHMTEPSGAKVLDEIRDFLGLTPEPT